MKRIIFFMAIAISVLALVSCSKDCEVPLDLSGTTWSDSARISNVVYKPFTLSFNSNGTAIITIGSFSPFTGSWNKTPGSSIVYFFFDENATTKWKGEGTINTGTNVIIGTVTRTAPSAANGTFNAKKQ